MHWKLAHACVRGSAHLRSGVPNQDAAQCVMTGAEGDAPAVAVAAVSDGHGGARHFRSQIGSSLAVSTSVDVLLEFYLDASDADRAVSDRLKELQKSLADNWLAAVSSHLENLPLTEEELQKLETLEGSESRLAVEKEPVLAYGATLLVAAATDSLMVLLQLGDGEILCVSSEGDTTRPMPHDPRLSGNETTSLCQPEAWREFRSASFLPPEWPALVLLATDGYPNSFSSGEDFLKIGPHYLAAVRNEQIGSLTEELPQILSEASQHGSGDDITLAILHRERETTPAGTYTAPGDSAVPDGRRLRTEEHRELIDNSRRGTEDLLISGSGEESRTVNRTLRLIFFLLVVVVIAASIYFFMGRFLR